MHSSMQNHVFNQRTLENQKAYAFFACQVGVATAFAETVLFWKKQNPKARFKILATPVCAKTFQDNDLEIEVVNNFLEIRQTLETDLPLAIVTDTSGDVPYVRELWKWTKESQIPTACFVDQWSFIRERFLGEITPDLILVVDDNAAQLVQKYIKNPECIKTVGHPTLEKFWNLRKGKTEAAPSQSSTKKILVVSEPSPGPEYEAEFLKENGFCENDFLEATFLALSTLAEQLNNTKLNDQRQTHSNMQIEVTLRLHPRDSKQRFIEFFEKLNTRFPEFKIEHLAIDFDSRDKITTLSQTDLVIGMRSIFLLESWFFGTRTLSIQPKRIQGSPLTDNRPGLIVCTDTEMIANQIRDHLLSPNQELDNTGSIDHQKSKIAQNSSRRFIEAICALPTNLNSR